MEWAGRVVERATGKRLGELMQEYLFGPAEVIDITSVLVSLFTLYPFAMILWFISICVGLT